MPNNMSDASNGFMDRLRPRSFGRSAAKWPVQKAAWFAVGSSLLLWTALIAAASALI